MLEILKGKRVLVVDDEPEVCDFIGYELSDCRVDTAVSFEQACERFATAGPYDVVILDIMGVRGYELLEEFGAKVPCIMLTARALTEADLRRSIQGRAVLYLPKEELGDLDQYVAKALVAKEPLWTWLFRRLDFTRWFGDTFKPSVQAAAGAEGQGKAPP